MGVVPAWTMLGNREGEKDRSLDALISRGSDSARMQDQKAAWRKAYREIR